VSSRLGDDLSRVIRELSERIREAVEASLTATPPQIMGGYRRPLADTITDDTHLYAVVELPGCSKDKISVNIHERELEVSAEYGKPPFPGAERLYPYRASMGYRRLLVLPRQVDPNDVEARFQDGVLFLKVGLAKPKGVRVSID